MSHGNRWAMSCVASQDNGIVVEDIRKLGGFRLLGSRAATPIREGRDRVGR